jgi:DNA-directed RNA polymerase specialized sigma subunit
MILVATPPGEDVNREWQKIQELKKNNFSSNYLTLIKAKAHKFCV